MAKISRLHFRLTSCVAEAAVSFSSTMDAIWRINGHFGRLDYKALSERLTFGFWLAYLLSGH